jgi:hypothetical protein
MYAGRSADKAHSDALQLLVEQGVKTFTFVILILVLLLGWLFAGPPTPERATVVCLTTQSIFDNRLHHPACAALYLLVWVAAFCARSQSSASDLCPK